jgi:hypothetical protein
MASWPDVKTNPPALMAWEYGPMAAGASEVCTVDRVMEVS